MSCQESTFKLNNAVLFDGRQQSWRDSSFACPVPSMITEDEVRFLHYLSSRQYCGEGAIVDFGPLAGASAYSLAAGLSGRGHVFSYDLWQFYPSWGRFFPGKTLQQGDDILPCFLEYTAPFRDRITPIKGDLAEQQWDHGPIELIFIDAAKSPKAMWHIVNEFFPHLVPGGYVIHQDYISAECPWIHMAVQHVAEYFDYSDSPDRGTVCVQLRKKLPPGVLQPDYFDSTPVDVACVLLEHARRNLKGWYRLCVWLSEANYLVSKQELGQASRILEAVLADPAFVSWVQNDVDLVKTALRNARTAIWE